MSTVIFLFAFAHILFTIGWVLLREYQLHNSSKPMYGDIEKSKRMPIYYDHGGVKRSPVLFEDKLQHWHEHYERRIFDARRDLEEQIKAIQAEHNQVIADVRREQIEREKEKSQPYEYFFEVEND